MFLCNVSDESMLTALMRLMYRMTEHSRVDRTGNVAEDEGVSCHANQLPRLLGVVINILTKKPATDQVLRMAYTMTAINHDGHKVYHDGHSNENVKN